MSSGEAPRELIARLGQKMVDKLREPERSPAETAQDAALATLEQEIADLVALLDAETAAASGGNFAGLTDSGGRKAEKLAQVEQMLAAMPDLEARVAGAESLRRRLEALREAAARNASVLEAVAEGARMISAEIQRIRERHSSAGLYGRDGQSREKLPPPATDHIDREF